MFEYIGHSGPQTVWASMLTSSYTSQLTVFLYTLEQGLLRCLAWHWAHPVAHGGFGFAILLSQPSEYLGLQDTTWFEVYSFGVVSMNCVMGFKFTPVLSNCRLCWVVDAQQLVPLIHVWSHPRDRIAESWGWVILGFQQALPGWFPEIL